MKKNDQYILQDLANAYYKKNRLKNNILICTVALSIFLLYSCFSIVSGKMTADYMLYVRNSGEITNTYLENGSETQYESIKKLEYIEKVGVRKGIGCAKIGAKKEGRIEYLDEVGYEELVVPAYSDIHGTYPKNKDEIMLPMRWLEDIGIDDPKPGMEILLEMKHGEDKFQKRKMQLSGYYTDYVNPDLNPPIGYISQKYLKEYEIPVFPAEELMILQKDSFGAEKIEESLYKDVEMAYDSQQFIGYNTLARQSLEDLFGDYMVMACCGIIVISSAFLLIFNVTNIAARKEIRQYGLLKTIGYTAKQLRAVMLRQHIKVVLVGSVIGGAAGLGLVGVLLPGTLQSLFYKEEGTEGMIPSVYPVYLVCAILGVWLITMLAMNFAVGKVIRMSAIESMKYSDSGRRAQKNSIHSKRGSSIGGMAWRNMKSSPKKLAIVILSLFIGYTTVLGAAVISAGTDLTNDILENPDFKISSIIEMNMISEYIPEQYSDDTPVLPREILETWKNMDGVENFVASRGGYAVIQPQKDQALSPKMHARENEDKTEDFATLQIADEKYLDELEAYIKEYNISIDFDSLREGKGVILLHRHELSEILEAEAEKVIGEKIQFYSLKSYGQEKMENLKLGEMECSGYIDISAKHFPKLQMTVNGNYINYFIISEKGFENLGMEEKYFALSINADKQKEPIMKQKIKSFIQEYNKDTEEWNQITLYCNSDLLAAAKKYITATNLVLGTLGAILLFIGIMNYINTIFTDIQVRKHELIIMESIGMTGKQLRKLLMMEGIGYWGIVLALEATAGYMVLWMMGKRIKEQLPYFKFSYPWGCFFLLAVILLIMCAAISEYMYRKSVSGSISERLKSE